MSIVAGDLDQAPPGPLRAAWATFYPDLITLVLILVGVMDLPDVLTAYAAESAAMGVITLWYAGGWRVVFSRAALTFVLMPLAFGAIVMPRVDWNWKNLLAILAVFVSTTIGEIRSQRSDPRGKRSTILTLMWRFVVIVFGAIVDVEWVSEFHKLDAGGWDATSTGIPMFPVGAWFDRWVLTSGTDPMLVATLVFFGFKTVNETLLAAYRPLRDRWHAAGGGSILASGLRRLGVARAGRPKGRAR